MTWKTEAWTTAEKDSKALPRLFDDGMPNKVWVVYLYSDTSNDGSNGYVVAVCRNIQDAERKQRRKLESIRSDYDSDEDTNFESGQSYLSVNEEDYYNVGITEMEIR